MHPVISAVTERLIERSAVTRQRYLQLMTQQYREGTQRSQLSCTNLAHDFAASPDPDKLILKSQHRSANIAIVSAYNDLLSAHAPYLNYPQQIKQTIAKAGHVAQFAAGVPAMCDGITQGQVGMELSLFSRDTIALSTSIALSHQVFDGVLMLGICDKIVPGLLMAALRFGHLPSIFVPAGPMSTGISNSEKAQVRQQHARGEVDDSALLDSEMKSYHSAGTCTFFGTANTNQLLMEIMGLQLPGSSFVNPNDPLRRPLTELAAQRITEINALADDYRPLMQVVDEKSLINGVIGLLASGGSTNHTLHLVAIARLAGIQLQWQDIADLSAVVPLLCRIYPNGKADINAFQQAGGMPFLIRELLEAGCLHNEVTTIIGSGLDHYIRTPCCKDSTSTFDKPSDAIEWRDAHHESSDLEVLAPTHAPFMREGGLKLLHGNIGDAILKVSAVAEEYWTTEAPVRVFTSQEEVLAAYQQHELDQDQVVVVIGQGPSANGMPELHKLMPALTNLQQAGWKVALVTDGRLSGASGKVPAAIHVSPEAAKGGAIGKLRDGDIVRIDGHLGQLEMVKSIDGSDWLSRPEANVYQQQQGAGRELFSVFRQQVSSADTGAISIGWHELLE